VIVFFVSVVAAYYAFVLAACILTVGSKVEVHLYATSITDDVLSAENVIIYYVV